LYAPLLSNIATNHPHEPPSHDKYNNIWREM
jgi:hypothetical protein